MELNCFCIQRARSSVVEWLLIDLCFNSSPISFVSRERERESMLAVERVGYLGMEGTKGWRNVLSSKGNSLCTQLLPFACFRGMY